MADQTMPERPVFVMCDVTTPPRGEDNLLRDTEGNPWRRVVYGSDGVCAAEDADGTIWVWDQDQLFSAVFRAMGERRG